MRKVEPPVDCPPEEGHYLRGNDLSPVAVVIILTHPYDNTPSDIENLARAGIEAGAALSGTLQTENIGIEKMLCNLVANPHIRHLVLAGPESCGHLTGDALGKLMSAGVDERKKIIGAEAPTPYLFNVPARALERFREQISLVNLLNEGDPDLLRKAVWSCFQEQPTRFREYQLFDPGALPADPICSKITWRVTKPEREPKSEEERRQAQRSKDIMERTKRRVQERKENKE